MKPTLRIKWNNELAISLLFFGPQINYYIANILNIHGLPSISTYTYAILYIIGLFSYLVTLQRRKSLYSFLLMVGMLGISAIINPEVELYMFNSAFFTSSLPILLFIYYPVFLLMLGNVDFNKMIGYFKKLSIITLIVGILSFYGYLFVQKRMPPDYMSFAYMMLTPILLCLVSGWNNNVIPFILAVVCAFITFIVGCRGAVVTMAVFFFLYVLFTYAGGEQKKNSVLKLVLLLVISLVAINAEAILSFISITLSGIGFTSRTVNKLLMGGGAFIESEGRQAIWSQAIRNTGFLGKGLFGDRTVILDEYAHAAYAHNVILELLVDFGWIIGIIVALVFVSYVLRAYIVSRKSIEPMIPRFSIIMVSILFAKHMISASFLTSFDFWLYFGAAINLVAYRSHYLKQNETASMSDSYGAS